MILREAIIKKASSQGGDTLVFVHKFGFDADGDGVAIVETMKGDVAKVYVRDLKFKNPITLVRMSFWEFIKAAFKAKGFKRNTA